MGDGGELRLRKISSLRLRKKGRIATDPQSMIGERATIDTDRFKNRGMLINKGDSVTIKSMSKSGQLIFATKKLKTGENKSVSVTVEPRDIIFEWDEDLNRFGQELQDVQTLIKQNDDDLSLWKLQ